MLFFQSNKSIKLKIKINDYILDLDNHSRENGNEKIDDFIREIQSDIDDFNDIVFEWIPYNQFDEIKEMGKNGSITIYSAIWKDGPLYYNNQYSNYTRDPNKKVTLKYLHNSENSVDSLINEAKKYSVRSNKMVFQIYGISQNLYTSDYILVLKDFIWPSGNEKIDNFIQEKQSDIDDFNDIVFEWIPYNQFDEIKEMGKNGSITIYSAIWKDGPLCYNNQYSNYTRNSNKEVALKYLHNSGNSTDFLTKVKKYSAKIFGRAIRDIYGISQNPNTNNYILVLAWASGNKKIDNFIKEMQLKINDYDDIVFEWIPYNSQFNNIKEIGKGGFSTVYSAIWKDGPLEYDADKKIYTNGDPNRVIALKCLHDSQNITDKFLNEVKEYSINKRSNILNVYGISQNPHTKDYIMVLDYAKDGNFIKWTNENYEYFNWQDKLSALLNIINGLKEIHQKNIVHRNFHTGNILFLNSKDDFSNCISISDMGLCGEVGNIDETKIFGVIPYVAPEVLRGKSYTKAADIYSFGMIMYFVATGRQPFYNRAHDNLLALDICNGNSPEINEPEAPRCYIDLMKKCWDLNPKNRPHINEVDEVITSLHKSSGVDIFIVKNEEIEMQFKEAEEYRKANLSSIKNYQADTHTQAIYTSRLLNPFTKNLSQSYNEDYESDLLDYAI
ncbi:uncharacterized protein OCT59_025655 [Rhizophagus irregularis]|uniref:uncharacterized protein n=1 Tax=Rhizophagus irregularis TaxID=588596 RepID=UPI00331A81C2|nr:hypothetical protein OCT59_025655 [Rhizophagus irregularis]